MDKRDNLLTPEEVNSRLTPEQMREKMSMMGKASAKARREAKTLREIGQTLSKVALRDGDVSSIEEIKNLGELRGANLSVKEMMFWQQIQKALNGDTKAFEVVRDTIGEKPIDKLQVAELDPEVVGEVEAEVLSGDA